MDLPKTPVPNIREGLPVLIYNAYNLDPAWHTGEPANRILLLEPSHYKKYPVSEKVLQFIIDLSKNIEGIQIFTGEFDDLKAISGNSSSIFKAHTAFKNYAGTAENYDDLFPQVNGYFSSFFSYWKKCEKYLNQI
jgi:deoxyribodipyrimidine photo-lyase